MLAGRLSGLRIAIAITLWATLSVAGLAVRAIACRNAVRGRASRRRVYLGICILLSTRHGPCAANASSQKAVCCISLFATILPAHAPQWVYGATIGLAAATAFGWFSVVALMFSVGRVQQGYQKAWRVEVLPNQSDD